MQLHLRQDFTTVVDNKAMKKKIERQLIKLLSLRTLGFLGFINGETKPRKKSYSQYGEDLVILNFFEKIGQKTDGFYVDIGAYHPTLISNTHLLHKNNWTGVCLDLCEEKLKWFRYRRGAKVKTICAGVSTSESGREISVFKHKKLLSEIDTLSKEIAQKNKLHHGYDFIEERILTLNINDLFIRINREIDLLNIDIEGLDQLVLGAIDFKRFRPKVILFEDNENFGGSTDTVNMLVESGYRHLFSSGGSVAYYSADLLANNY